MNWIVAEASGPHIAITPEKLFEIGSFQITNSIFYGWISAIIIVCLLLYMKSKVKLGGTKGISDLLDGGTEFILGTLESSLGSRKRAVRYAPLFVTTFFFIVMNNWLGLLPGVGPAVEYHGSPLLRPFTADLNATLSMAIVMVLVVIYLSMRESSPLRHVRHYFQGSLKNPMTIILGMLEMFSELTRIASLALRLFLNVVIGEILIAIFAHLGSSAAPLSALPFTLLEIFVGLLQAYIFVVLCISYLAVATSHNHDESHGKEMT